MHVSRTRQALILSASVICVVYLVYRALYTFNLTSPYAVCASAALFAAELYTGILMLLFLLQVWRPSQPPQQPVLTDRTVDVFVPTYNEDVQILRTTLRACLALDYPCRIFLLDDGKRAEAEQLAADLGVGYITRMDNKHAKAGNMNNALKQTDGEFIVILDADHVPDPNFISRLLGYFADEQLAYVQTPHAFYNFDSFQARYDARRNKYWDEGQLFYDVIQPGRNRWNAAIFAGSATIFRRKSLEEIGGFAVETITEDLHTGLRLHAHGWKSLAISERLIAGQAAPDVTTFHSQRLRWGEGNLSIFAYDNPLWTPGLTVAQRLCYLGSMIHWAGGPFLFLIYLTPLLMLLTGVPPVNAFRWDFAGLIVLYMGLSYASFKATSGRLGSFWNSQLFSMTSVWTSIRSVFRAMFRRRFQKFVVTSKRGRQSKSVLPFIWPQATLFILSILALCWGWYLPLSGISDDYYKPIIASIWTVFHMCVAAVVIHRSLWPESRRFDYRHVVTLPVVYEKDGVAGYGVTVDLHDAGAGLLAYDRLEVGDRLRVAVRGAGLEVECEAVVRWCREIDARLRAGTRGFRVFRCGVRFVDPRPEQADQLNQLCWHYAVPLRYQQFGRPRSVDTRRLPVLLETAAGTTYAVSNELTAEGFTALLDEELPADTEVRFVMPTPGEEVHGTAVVVADDSETLAGRPYQRMRVKFQTLEGRGREVIDALVQPAARRRLQPLVAPYPGSRPVPVRRAVSAAAVILALLLPAEFLAFHGVFRDDFFLLGIASGSTPLTDSERQRLLAITTETLQEQRYPSNDRLVLLESALLNNRLYNHARQVTLVLAKRDTDNLDLQLAYAQALDDTGESQAALEEYLSLLKRIDHGAYPPERRGTVLLSAARAAVHSRNVNRAVLLFQDVLANPDGDATAVRNELAGVLLQAGRPKQAIRLYEGRQPDFTGQTILARAHLQTGDYPAAEKEAKDLLATRPGDLTSQLLLLRALVMQGKLVESSALVNRLFQEFPDSVIVRSEMGQLALANQGYDKALLLFQGLLEGKQPLGDERDKILRGFVDAAASVDDVNLIRPEVVQEVEKVFAARPAESETDYLTRLAWVFERLHEPAKAADLLQRLLKVQPNSPDLRHRYVFNLQEAGQWKEAQAYLESLPPSPDVRQMLVELLITQKEFAAAEKIVQDLLRNNPFSVRGTLLLAEIQLARKDEEAARRLLEQVRQSPVISPTNQALMAGLSLWAGEPNVALAEFRTLLEKSFDQPELWEGYINAASAAPTLTPADDDLVMRIAGQTMASSHDAVFLARLGWVLHRQHRPEQARQSLERALALKPTAPAVRKELAGILGAVGMFPEAVGLYRGLKLDAADHRRLASLYEAANDFAGAAKQYRLILQENPADLAVRERLAQVLIWAKDYKSAIPELQRLVGADPRKTAWKVQLAEIQLWSGDAAAALATYTDLLEKDADQPDLWTGFVDAAGTAPALDEREIRVAKDVGRLVAAAPPKESVFLSRLAWVLVRAGDSARAQTLVDRAVALQPTEPAVRKEVAGVLGAVGQYRRAIQMLKGLDLTFDDRLKLVHLYNGDRDFAAAEAECRELLGQKPGDARVELLLADILAWRGKYDEAAGLLRRLQRTDPDAPDLALKLARVDLWGRNYGAALRQFAGLIEKDPKQKDAWSGFVEAAAGNTGPLDDRYRKLLQDLYESTLASPPPDPLYLGRLADAMRRLQEPAKAVRLLQKAVALDPTSRPLQLQLAEALYAVGRFDEAERYFRAVLRESKSGAR